jgi:hypothetical protein
MASVGAVRCDEKKPVYRQGMKTRFDIRQSRLETMLERARQEASRRAAALEKDAMFWGSERGQQKIARQREVASEREAKAKADRAAAKLQKEADFWKSEAGLREVHLEIQKNTIADFWGARRKPIEERNPLEEDSETSSQCTMSTSQSTACTRTLSPEAEEEVVQQSVDATKEAKRLTQKHDQVGGIQPPRQTAKR